MAACTVKEGPDESSGSTGTTVESAGVTEESPTEGATSVSTEVASEGSSGAATTDTTGGMPGETKVAEWTVEWSDPMAFEIGHAVAVALSGEILVAGVRDGGQDGETRGWVAAVDPNGQKLWRSDFVIPGGGKGSDARLALDAADTIYLATDQLHRVTMTGELVWATSLMFAPMTRGFDSLLAVGDGVYTAHEATPGEKRIIRHDPASGDPLWDTPLAVSDSPVQLAAWGDRIFAFSPEAMRELDADDGTPGPETALAHEGVQILEWRFLGDDLLARGEVLDPSSPSVLRRTAQDGTPVWEHMFGGPDAYGMALGPAGAIAVAGTIDDEAPLLVGFTADGAMTWTADPGLAQGVLGFSTGTAFGPGFVVEVGAEYSDSLLLRAVLRKYMF